MSDSVRRHAIDSIAQRVVKTSAAPDENEAPVDYYGKDVFNAAAIRKFLSRGAAEKLLATIQDGKRLDPNVAGDVAHAMKDWAISRGAGRRNYDLFRTQPRQKRTGRVKFSFGRFAVYF